MLIYKLFLSNKYLLHEILATNHNCKASLPAEIGYLRALKYTDYLHYDRYTIQCAANSGQLQIVKWLHTNRNDGATKSAMDLAAANGHLKIVIWLHCNRSEGCSKWAIDDAAARGHFEIVRWLCENRTEGFTKFAITWATQEGYPDIAEWLSKFKSIK